MPRESRFSSLCPMIDESLRRYTEAGEVVTSTRETEKDLLLSLSQLLSGLQQLTRQLDSDSDSGEDTSPKPSGSKLHPEEHNCLIKILADLILLLTVESQYVQHLVGNILAVISEFVASSAAEWDSYIRSLCVLLELVICHLLSYPLRASADVDENFDASNFVFLKARVQHANWSTAAGIVRVLCNILKHMKQECDDQLLEMYLASVCSLLSNVPLEFMDETHFVQDIDSRRCNGQESQLTDALFTGGIGGLGPKVVFLGHFVRFICSLVDQTNGVEDDVGSEDKNPVISMIISLVPRLLRWCLGKQGDSAKYSISHYFRHKLLMLMLRLSYQTSLGCSIILSWLQLLHEYFGELLMKPITELESGQDQCLEGSPFVCSDLDAPVGGRSSLHLQRHAVLLFLRCCFSIVGSIGETNEHCACTPVNSCLNFDCCSRKKGLLELYKWIQGHTSIGTFVNQEMYLEKFVGFRRSFLQLYMHEDDALFKVLLELHSIHSYLDQGLHGEKVTIEDVNQDFIFWFSNFFHPINLFHLFLSELHYDHQVLLDYLISKDTGISCVEYLLRCLRTVCASWHLFIQFSLDGKFRHQCSCKKRRTSMDGFNFQTEPSFVPAQSIPSLMEQECERDYGYGCKHQGTGSNPFIDAKDCLLSLKHSVENLHQKNLFPYNPEVLLKRLTRFQELCINQDNGRLV